MTIAELIASLSLLDPTLLVLTYGYEGGYSDIHIHPEKTVALDVNSDWYYGPHDDADEDSASTAQAIILARAPTSLT